MLRAISSACFNRSNNFLRTTAKPFDSVSETFKSAAMPEIVNRYSWPKVSPACASKVSRAINWFAWTCKVHALEIRWLFVIAAVVFTGAGASRSEESENGRGAAGAVPARVEQRPVVKHNNRLISHAPPVLPQVSWAHKRERSLIIRVHCVCVCHDGPSKGVGNFGVYLYTEQRGDGRENITQKPQGSVINGEILGPFSALPVCVCARARVCERWMETAKSKISSKRWSLFGLLVRCRSGWILRVGRQNDERACS